MISAALIGLAVGWLVSLFTHDVLPTIVLIPTLCLLAVVPTYQWRKDHLGW